MTNASPNIPGISLSDWLAKKFPQAKKTTLRDMIADKRVHLNGMPAKSLKQIVEAKDKVEVVDASSVPMKPHILDEGLRILYQDADIFIVDKPTGLLTATDEKEQRPTTLKILTNFAQRTNQKAQVHLIHRLDKDASGLLVFARNVDAVSSLKKQFFYHTVTRRYDAIVHGIPKKPKARLENLLLEDPVTGSVAPTKDLRKGQIAILDYELIARSRSSKFSHVQCTLQTGRKHQIRVQLHAIGHPVCGDLLYRKSTQFGATGETPGRLALHASHLTLEHPSSGKRIAFDSPMPQTFSELLRK